MPFRQTRRGEVGDKMKQIYNEFKDSQKSKMKSSRISPRKLYVLQNKT